MKPSADNSAFDTLARQAQSGDLEAAEALVRALHNPLFALLHLRGIPEKDVEDEAQTIMLHVCRHLSAYDPARPFMPWFRTIARNLTVNYWQKNTRDKNRFSEFRDYVAAAEPELDARCDALDRKRGRLASCMEKLKGKQRVLLRLCYFDRCDSESIARKTGAEPPAVRKALQRVRALLRACMEREAEDPIAA